MTAKEKPLCGACQVWGCDPDIRNGTCEICHRTEEAIQAAHGKVFLTKEEKEKTIKPTYMFDD